jgi:hypothetical protein
MWFDMPDVDLVICESWPRVRGVTGEAGTNDEIALRKFDRSAFSVSEGTFAILARSGKKPDDLVLAPDSGAPGASRQLNHPSASFFYHSGSELPDVN